MKISPVYTMPFSFHSGLGFCLHNTVSPYTVMVSPYSVMGNGSTAQSAQLPLWIRG